MMSTSCPALLQFDWLIIGQKTAILPDGFSCYKKLKTHVVHNCLKILEKIRNVIELVKMLSINLVSDYFSENSRCVFRTIFEEFESQQKTLGKRFWTNFKKKTSENCLQIFGECSEHFRFCHIVNYLLTGLLVLFLASSVRTSNFRA